jgi:superfamily I DNA/RNA helicase
MRLNPTQIFDGLNDAQKEAVASVDVPLLIVAGPGTGKTLTIVRRIAWLIHQGVRPEHILAVTFTNRAAREMRERAEAILGAAGRIFIGTLHLFGLRVMKEALSAQFSLVSREEQTEVLKSLLKGSAKKARQAGERISRIKNRLEEAGGEAQEIHKAYQSYLSQNHAVDFDDLILTPIELLKSASPAGYSSRFSHIMVDEYQDINPAQYEFLRLIAQNGANFCAIGDSDQAVYGFRGADAAAFLSFGRDFRDAKTITLTQNYRSTGTVLSASNSLIRYNQRRIVKEVTACRDAGGLISVVSAPDERSEAEFIIREIETRIGGTSHHQMRSAGSARDEAGESCFSDFAVIYRTNAQARAIEEVFIDSGIPYQVIGRKTSLQSKERGETVAWLMSLTCPDATAVAESDPSEARLLTAADYFDPRANAVTLTTMHTAKGLEFAVVFIAGCEDGMVPFTLNRDEADIEEERRLFYVAMTRAKRELLLLHCRSRFLYGQRLAPSPSPFLKELPERLTRRIVVPDRVLRTKEPDKQMGLF